MPAEANDSRPASDEAVVCKEWLGIVDEDTAHNCCVANHSVCSDDLCYLSLEDMQALEKAGLVEMLPKPPDYWPEAQYGYHMTDKGESLAKQYRDWLSMPNAESSYRSGPVAASNKPAAQSAHSD